MSILGGGRDGRVPEGAVTSPLLRRPAWMSAEPLDRGIGALVASVDPAWKLLAVGT